MSHLELQELFLFQRGEGRLEHHDAVADSSSSRASQVDVI